MRSVNGYRFFVTGRSFGRPYTWEERRFYNPKEEADRHEAGETRSARCSRGDGRPDDDAGWEVYARADGRKNHVGRELRKHIADVQD